MKRRTAVVIIFIVAILAAAAWAITLELNGRHAEADKFVTWAGGGLGLGLVCALLLGALD